MKEMKQVILMQDEDGFQIYFTGSPNNTEVVGMLRRATRLVELELDNDHRDYLLTKRTVQREHATCEEEVLP